MSRSTARVPGFELGSDEVENVTWVADDGIRYLLPEIILAQSALTSATCRRCGQSRSSRCRFTYSAMFGTV